MSIVLSIVSKDGVPILTYPAKDESVSLISGVFSAINILTTKIGMGSLRQIETNKGVALCQYIGKDKMLIMLITNDIPRKFMSVIFYLTAKEIEEFADLIEAGTPLTKSFIAKFETKLNRIFYKINELVEHLKKLERAYLKLREIFGVEADRLIVELCKYIEIKNGKMLVNVKLLRKENVTIDLFLGYIKDCENDIKREVRRLLL